MASYEFTTLTCIPGVEVHRHCCARRQTYAPQHKGAQIQLLDLPGIIEGAAEGKGRGKQVIAVARTADLIMIVLDAAKVLSAARVMCVPSHMFMLLICVLPVGLFVCLFVG